MNYYLDSSAILKLIFDENERRALVKAIGNAGLTTSIISRVETIRTVQRSAPTAVGSAQDVLAQFSFVPLNDAVVRIAESFTASTTLCSLDAIHVASALFTQNLIFGIITYDKSMKINAERLGIKVLAPA